MSQTKISHISVDAKDLRIFKVLAAERGITMMQLFHECVNPITPMTPPKIKTQGEPL